MSRKLLTGADVNNQKIINLADGTAATDAINLGQLQAVQRGTDWKESVRAAATTNLTLSGTQTVDGVALVAGDRVLAPAQTTGSANGIYVVAAGAWSRSLDADTGTEVNASIHVPVEAGGTVNGGKIFYLATTGTVTLGTTSLTFSVLPSGSNPTSGSGAISVSGTAVSFVPKSGGGLSQDGSGAFIDPAGANVVKKWSENVPSGSTTATITHNLGTKDRLGEPLLVIVATGEVVEADIVLGTSADTLTFATAPTSGQYRYSTAA